MSHSATQTHNATLTQARSHFVTNVLSNLAWLVVNAVVMTWYTPYLVGNLGVALYGLVPLADSVTRYMGVLTQSFNGAISRFLTIDLTRKDFSAANRTFNTALASSLVIGAILLPIAFALSWAGPGMFNVPPGCETDARWLLLLVTTAFIVRTLANSFAVSSYTCHRFDLRRLVEFVGLVVQTGSLVLLFTVSSARLWHVGIAMFLSALSFLLGEVLLWRQLTPELGVRLALADAIRFKTMMGFSGWVLVNNTGALFFTNIDLIVANLVFGAQVAGRYGAVMVLPTALRTLARAVTGVMDPIITALYAKNDSSRLVRLSSLGVRFTGLAIALPVGLLCGLARPLLTAWLGNEFADMSLLVVLLVGHLCVNVAVLPLFSVQSAVHRVRIPGIVTLGMGLANAVLAIALALWGGWGYWGIAAAGAIVLTAKNAVFTPLYSARILRVPWWTFLPSLMVGSLAALVIGTGAYFASSGWNLTDWRQLIFVAASISVLYAIVAYTWGLNKDDRRLLKSELRRRTGL